MITEYLFPKIFSPSLKSNFCQGENHGDEGGGEGGGGQRGSGLSCFCLTSRENIYVDLCPIRFFHHLKVPLIIRLFA